MCVCGHSNNERFMPCLRLMPSTPIHPFTERQPALSVCIPPYACSRTHIRRHFVPHSSTTLHSQTPKKAHSSAHAIFQSAHSRCARRCAVAHPFLGLTNACTVPPMAFGASLVPASASSLASLSKTCCASSMLARSRPLSRIVTFTLFLASSHFLALLALTPRSWSDILADILSSLTSEALLACLFLSFSCFSCWYFHLAYSMMRHTGGSLLGDISTKSIPRSSA
mmetsp:Transcript_6615/g.16006  ORF Transcript_6615/g.16006 Transcript_6615/m.16006 type:complete len:225 (-) Transcript_6615:454-1128(-)